MNAPMPNRPDDLVVSVEPRNDGGAFMDLPELPDGCPTCGAFPCDWSETPTALAQAAPDLLAALEQSALYVETLHSLMISDGRRTPATLALMVNIKASRAALAKANRDTTHDTD